MRKAELRVIRYKHSKSSKWVIEGKRVNGKRAREFFKTKEEAETRLLELQVRIQNEGIGGLAIKNDLRIMAAKCDEKLKVFGRTLEDASNFYIEYLQLVERTCTFNQLLKEFLIAKERDGKSARYLKDLRLRLSNVAQVFGERKIATILSREIDDWLRGLPMNPQSRNNFRTVLSTFFNFAIARGYAKENPIVKTAKAKTVDDAPEIFTLKEISDLLNHAASEVLPYLAIGAFAGLRSAEIERLDWKEVNLERGFIEVTANKAKSARRRLVKILPNLSKWLAPYAQEKGKVAPPNLRAKIDAARKKAEIEKWPDNGLRHSYISYHIAHFNDAPALALQAGHTNTNMIFQHYREVVHPEDAAFYWQIEPQSAISKERVT